MGGVVFLKAILISDTHNYHHELDLPDGDILIHTGDFTLSGDVYELDDFNQWLGKQDFNDIIVIAGNHDRCISNDPMYGWKHLTNATYLQNSGVEIDGKYFWGSPMTPAFNGMRDGLTFFTNDDKEAKNVWRGMPKKTDVLLTHGPPYGILDEVEKFRFVPSGQTFNLDEDEKWIENCGDKMLLSKIIKVQPKFHIFGHIHEGYGIKKDIPYMPNTTFINASSVNSAYGMQNKPMEIEI